MNDFSKRMNRKYIILYILFLILIAGATSSCSDLDDFAPDGGPDMSQGRYLSARSADGAIALDDPDKTTFFPVGTPYRLLAYAKAYDENNSGDATPATYRRFNMVAWEGDASGLRFFNVESNPDMWFGFPALPGEPSNGTGGRVSLDFYGFTYGVEEAHNDTYIPLDDNTLELTQLKRTESVDGTGVLKDMRRGQLLNQNVKTAAEAMSAGKQSIMPFEHCFSRLHFLVVQQSEDEPDANGNPVPCFPGISIEEVKVTNTYLSGAVYLQTGKVELFGNPTDRQLNMVSANIPVKTTQSEVGEMLVYPSHKDDLVHDASDADFDGYSIGIVMKVRSGTRAHLEAFLRGTGNPDGEIITENGIDPVSGGATTSYYTIINKDVIYNSHTNKPLRLKHNTNYTLEISFQRDAVRVITVIPLVEEWLPGEGNWDNPWEEQEIGNPQMFDNVLWSDRNLGADEFDPFSKRFEETLGYFYQAGRNIPYYPFPIDGGTPNYDDMDNQGLGDAFTGWELNPGNKNKFFLYPVVDEEILSLYNKTNWRINSDQTPQMYIPEKKPTDAYFDFMKGNDSWHNALNGHDILWNSGQARQPVAGSWVIPTARQFRAVFPSTPFAGNIAMRTGGNSEEPMNWGAGANSQIPESRTKTLRVTVPYYVPGMAKPTGRSDDYVDAWQILHDNEDHDGYHDYGTTHLDVYWNGKPGDYTRTEPDGDPRLGTASVYVISWDTGSKVSLPENYSECTIKSWGTIYAIKRVYTAQAYRMRWRALVAEEGSKNPGIVIEICRYRCNANDHLNEENYMSYDWDHPAARIYFPISGLGDYTGSYINYGMECQYATAEPILSNGRTTAVQIKVTGNNDSNVYIAVINDQINRLFGMQIRPVSGVIRNE